MSIEDKIISLIEPPLVGLGYEVVRVKQIGNDVIQVLLDLEGGIGIDECTKAARLINHILQVAEVSENYGVEVSSPGLDRPLVKPEHFLKFIGKEIRLNTQLLLDGRKKFLGILTDFDKESHQITLTCEEDKVVKIDFDQMQSANLYYK